MTTTKDNWGVLHGVRVIDLTRMLSGPYCTMMLADHGAEVIKIESFEGDTSRGHGPYRDDDPENLFGGYFQSLNRNKLSVALDLKSPPGVEILVKLVKSADVLVENFRPGVMERLGLGYETLRDIHPRLVYAAIRGFGDPRSGESPYSNWPSYDVVAQAMGGAMAITGPDAGTPTKIGPGIGDIAAGLQAAFGIVAALRHADRTGSGQFVDVAMYDAIMSLAERSIYQFTFANIVAGPEGSGHPFFTPFGIFPARDGHITIACPNDKFWRKLCAIIGRPELGDDPRSARKVDRAANKAFIDEVVSKWTVRFSKAELTALLGGKIPYGPVNTAQDILNDPHVEARRMIARVDHPGSDEPSRVVAPAVHFQDTPGGVRRHAPCLSEHAAELLRELGYATDEIESLEEHGVVLACREGRGQPSGPAE